MIVASLFGVPAGLEVHHIPIGEDARIKIDDAWVDISLDEAALTGDQTIIRTFRRSTSGRILTFVGVYRPAREIGPNREGGFYGAGLWIIDASISSHLILAVIIHLADQIRDLAMVNGKFLKKIADVRSAITPPPQVAKLVSNRVQLRAGLSIKSGEGKKAFITDTHNVVSIIDWAQCDSSAKIFEMVIVAPVEQYVPKKSTYSIGFERYDTLLLAIQSAYELNEHKLSIAESELKKKDEALKQKNVELKNVRDELISKDNDLKIKDGDAKRKDAYISSLNKDLHALRAKESNLLSELSALKSKSASQSMPNGMNRVPNNTTAPSRIGNSVYSPGSSSSNQASYSAEYADKFNSKGSHFFSIKLILNVALALIIGVFIGLVFFYRTEISELVLSQRLSSMRAHAEKLELVNKNQLADIEALKKQVLEIQKTTSTEKFTTAQDKESEDSKIQLSKYDVTFKTEKFANSNSAKGSDKKSDWINNETLRIVEDILKECSLNGVTSNQQWVSEAKDQIKKVLSGDSIGRIKVELPSDCKNVIRNERKEYVLTLTKQKK